MKKFMDFNEVLKIIAIAVSRKETVEIYYPKTDNSPALWREVIPESLATDIPPQGEVLIYKKDRMSPGHIFNAYDISSKDDKIRSFIIGKIKFARLTGNKVKNR